MYNDNYYSRRGRTIERKKVDNGQVINPKLVPVYYNYLKDNGLLPTPPAPVENGSYVTYQVDQEYSFPSSETSLFSVLGSMLDAFEIPVDITAVDSIRLEYTLIPSSSESFHRAFNVFVPSSSDAYPYICDALSPGTLTPYTYTMFFYRSSVDTFAASLFYHVDVSDYSLGANIPFYPPLSYVKRVDLDNRMVVKSITVSTYAS